MAEMTFAALQRRLYELADKDKAGALTYAELLEAQRLNKLWRAHPEFGTTRIVS